MRSLLSGLGLVLCAAVSHADWTLTKHADRDGGGGWIVGCEVRTSGAMSLLWDNVVFHKRTAAGQDPQRPVILFATDPRQAESRPLTGSPFAETCAVDLSSLAGVLLGGDSATTADPDARPEPVCEPATVEHRMEVAVIADGEIRRLDAWVQAQAYTVMLGGAAAGFPPEFLDALGGVSVGSVAVWPDYPDDLLDGTDVTLAWIRGGSSGIRSGGSPVGATAGLAAPLLMDRRLASCIGSHFRGGRVMSSRQLNSAWLAEQVKATSEGLYPGMH